MRGAHRLVAALVALAACTGAVSAQDAAASLAVTSDPAGAAIYLNGRLVGATPATVAIPRGIGQAELEIGRDGHVFERRVLDLAALPDRLDVRLAAARTVIPVTVADDRPPAPDGAITLREAIAYATGADRPVGTDRALIDGVPGAGRPDDIVISVPGQGPSPVLTLERPLPAFDDAGDRILGPPERAALAPDPDTALRGPGLILGPDTEVERLILDGFDTGLSGRGWGTALARDVTAQGGLIGFSAGAGAELLLSGADGSNRFADVAADDGGVVEGIVEPIVQTDFETLTLISGPPGEAGHTILEGRLYPGGDTYLYVRKEAAQPLTEIEGLDATTTSYDLYHIFGFGQSDQRWPWHVYDGLDGDYFKWAFEGDPIYENMKVTAERPLRTDRFTLHHLQNTDRLLRYKFSLTGRGGRVLWETEVEANADIDVIEVDPTLDFFGFRIDVLEATGSGPGFREIEAMVFDTVAYPPRSFSARRVVFPRPEAGRRGLIELTGDLLLLEDMVFKDRMPVAWDQGTPSRRAGEVAEVTLPESAGAVEFAAALVELEAAPSARIVVPGTLRIDAETPVIARSRLHLTGGGVIESLDGTPLRLTDAGDIHLSDLVMIGAGLKAVNSAAVGLSNVTITGTETAIELEFSDLVFANSRIADATAGIYGNGGGLVVIGSVIEAVDTGIDTRAADPLTLIGNEIVARREALRIRPEGGYASVANLIYNRAEPPLPLEPQERPSYHSTASLVAGNEPPFLGLPGATFSVENQPRWLGNGARDMRARQGPTYLRILDLTGSDARCLLFADPEVPPVAPPAEVQRGVSVVLHDTEVELYCQSRGSGATLTLPVAGGTGAAAPIPAAAYLRLSLAEGFAFVEEDAFGATEIAYAAEPIGDGAPFPALGASLLHDGLNSLIVKLTEGGDRPLAFERAYAALIESPRDGELSELVRITASNWANALRKGGDFEAARQLLEDLAAAEPSPPGAEALLVDVLLIQAGDDLEAAEWDRARALYRDVLARSPGQEVAAQNIVYAYHQQALQLLGDGGPDALVAWVRDESAARPADAATVAAAGGNAIGGAAVEAINAGRHEEGLRLASLNHLWAPDDRTRENLRIGFIGFAQDRLAAGEAEAAIAMQQELEQEHGASLALADALAQAFTNAAIEAINAGRFEEGLSIASAQHGWRPDAQSRENLQNGFLFFAQEQLARGDGAPVAAMLDRLTQAHGDGLGLAEGLAGVFGNSVQTAFESGDTVAALANAGLLHQIAPSADSGNLLAFAYGAGAQSLAERGDADAALSLLEDGLARYPEVAGLGDGARAVGNNAALAAYEAGDNAGAVALLERTLALIGDNENLSQNLLVIYSNWAIGEANAGRLDEARQIAEAGLGRFPGDETLTQVIDFVARSR